jgi:hypothetical protein
MRVELGTFYMLFLGISLAILLHSMDIDMIPLTPSKRRLQKMKRLSSHDQLQRIRKLRGFALCSSAELPLAGSRPRYYLVGHSISDRIVFRLLFHMIGPSVSISIPVD